MHGCYQDVIAQMLQEQERARASRSALLNAQAAHLTQIGDQWPAFQELQVMGGRHSLFEEFFRLTTRSRDWLSSLRIHSLSRVRCW